jgi:hypothetical protein
MLPVQKPQSMAGTMPEPVETETASAFSHLYLPNPYHQLNVVMAHIAFLQIAGDVLSSWARETVDIGNWYRRCCILRNKEKQRWINQEVGFENLLTA